MVPDARVFSSKKNEQKYPWLYDSVVNQGYLCKFCELFCGHSSSSQVGKSLTCNKQVGFKALCNKQVGFKALVISKSLSSLLIGCVRRPTPRTDKGSSSITDNMITFNGISVLNFKYKRYSL
jgi:hypothetical protein